MLKSFLVVVAFLALSFSSYATHIVGGELNYKYLGNDKYEIRLTVYRDCYIGVPPFDNPASLGVFNSNNTLVTSISMPFRGLDTLPATINDPCTIPPTDFCYEVTTYIDTITLPPLAGGYQLVYQRCCRNANILNLINPQNVGATYYATIPGPEVVTVNSNPVFKNWPPPFICVNKPWSFDNSAIDADGDSLVYELLTPFDFPDPSSPQPIPPNNPPYVLVPWNPPYNQSNMLGGTPLQINSQTGLVTATPNTLGYFVIGMKVKEYRNGVLISETKRDFQLIVKSCPTVVAAAAQVPQAICGTTSATFQNNSSGNNLQFNWYFGDPTTLGDTSHVTTPTYTYPATGNYSVTLVAYVSNKPLCNDTVATTVSIADFFTADFTFESEPCTPNNVKFYGTATFPPGIPPDWKWEFGDGTFSTDQNPQHTYIGSGSFNVILISSIPNSISCYDTIQAKTITIAQNNGIYIPNTFTPNNDGQNDVFRIRGASFPEFYFAVYNRWGEIVFETSNPATGWDGTYKGKNADPGVFGYYIKARCSTNTEEIFKKGNITLIR